MEISAEISLYPLSEDYVDDVKGFIRELRRFPGLTVVTNQMSTQVTGGFDAVTRAVTSTMRRSMEGGDIRVFVIKYLNRSLEIQRNPAIGSDPR